MLHWNQFLYITNIILKSTIVILKLFQALCEMIIIILFEINENL